MPDDGDMVAPCPHAPIDPLRHAGLIRFTLRTCRGRMSPDDLADVEQDLWVTLLEAVRDYDAGRGAMFSTYAAPQLRGRVASYFARRRGVAYRFADPGPADPDGHQEIDVAVAPGPDPADLAAARIDLAEAVDRWLAALTPTMAAVVAQRFDLAAGEIRADLKAIAAARGVSYEAIKQHVKAAENEAAEVFDLRVMPAARVRRPGPNATGQRPPPTAYKIAEADHATVAAMFWAGRKLDDIAADVGASNKAVRNLLTRLGLTQEMRNGPAAPPGARSVPRKIHRCEVAAVLARLRAGERRAAVAASYGLTARALDNYLLRNATPAERAAARSRQPGRPPKRADRQAAAVGA